MTDYQNKYLKYKNKYFELKNKLELQTGGFLYSEGIYVFLYNSFKLGPDPFMKNSVNPTPYNNINLDKLTNTLGNCAYYFKIGGDISDNAIHQNKSNMDAFKTFFSETDYRITKGVCDWRPIRVYDIVNKAFLLPIVNLQKLKSDKLGKILQTWHDRMGIYINNIIVVERISGNNNILLHYNCDLVKNEFLVKYFDKKIYKTVTPEYVTNFNEKYNLNCNTTYKNDSVNKEKECNKKLATFGNYFDEEDKKEKILVYNNYTNEDIKGNKFGELIWGKPK